ncbi:hypothetical protein VTJ83DRAFT_3071 [Remersonia thermophila]|uniref:FAD/NAD(P)-binding domain-containing protein n=1 Tax=Remersonia thermophila TaxID=72144 RepID=A0ABR4DD34_9PEZI
MGSLPEPQPFRVLIAGGSYGGLAVAVNLQDLCRGLPARSGPQPEDGEAPPTAAPQIPIDITIVDERDGYYHTIGTPLALASESFADKFWIKYADIPALRAPNLRVLHGSFKSVDPERKVATYVPHGSTDAPLGLLYDYFVAATGLRRAWPVVPQSLRRKQYLFEMGDHTRAMASARHGVLVVGGGAVGIEMAAELKTLQPHLNVTLAHSRDTLLSSEPLPDEFKQRTLDLLRETGVDVLLSHRVERAEEVKDDAGNLCLRVHFTNGRSKLVDHVSMAISRPVPSTTFLPPSVLDEEGYVKIRSDLRFPADAPNSTVHFAVGDLVRWSGIKRCGAAMHMGYYAAHNIHQHMKAVAAAARGIEEDPEDKQLDEILPAMGIALGKKAVGYWKEAGVVSGEKEMKDFFGDDLGFSICWNHLKLGEDGIEQC